MNIYGNSTIPNVVSISTPSVDDHVVTYDGVSGLTIQDSGVTIGSISGGPFLKLDGTTPMLANLNFGGFNVANCPNLIGSSKTTALNDIISQAANGVINQIPVYAGTSRILQNSTVAISSLLTSATAASTYMPLAGGTFTGAVDHGSQTLTVNNMLNNGSTGVKWGNGSTNSGGLSAILIGDNSTISGLDNVILGRDSLAQGTQSSALGINNYCQTGSIQALCVGFNNATSAQGALCLGTTNIANALNAYCIGIGLTNSTANSILFGYPTGSGVDIVNIRPSTNNTCDLGVASTNVFKNIYANGSLVGGTNTRTIDNIVSNSGTATSGRVATFASDKVIQDGGTLLSSLLTSSTASSTYMPLAGGTFSGNVAMGGNSITGFGTLVPTATNIQIGFGTANLLLRTVQISNSNLTGSANDTVIIGYDAVGVGCQRSVIIGPSSSVSGTNSIGIGYLATTTNQTQNIVVGASSSITSTAASTIIVGAGSTSNITGGHCFGAGLTNTVASILLQGGSNIRNNVDAACDLGTSALKFKDAYLSGSLVGTVKTSAVNSIVTGPASSVGNNISVFSDGTGKILATATSGIGTIGALTLANTTASTSTSTGTLILSGSGAGIGMAGNLNVGGTANIATSIAIGKTTAATGQFESVGTILSSNNGGAADKELFVDVTPAQTYSVISSYQQSVGVRDLSLQGQNISFFNAPLAGGGIGVLCLPNRGTAPAGATTNTGVIFVESGKLMYKGAAGNITQLAIS